jgi:hypothetical protein
VVSDTVKSKGSVRDRLMEDIAADYEAISANLIRIAKGGVPAKATYPACRHRQKKTLVHVPDNNTAVNAARTLLEQGFGKIAAEVASKSGSIRELAKRAEERFGLFELNDGRIRSLNPVVGRTRS